MKKVVLCDDDKYFSDFFRTLLDYDNIKCDVVSSSDEFAKIIDSLTPYDVIFLDIMLRKGTILVDDTDLETGEFLYGLVRKKYPEKKIAIISAKNQSDVKIKFNNNNTFFISKTSGGDLNEALAVINRS